MDSEAPKRESSQNLTLGLGLGALASWVLGVITTERGSEQSWLWYVMAGLGLAALVTGAMSMRGGRPGARAIVGLVLGLLAVLVFLAFVLGIVEE